MRYPTEHFSDEEQALLAPHFTNLDRPVFALVNLPETVKGALFARYSRYSGGVRRLYLDEFAADMPAAGRPFDAEEGARAAQLYERVFVGYGDDSIAQVGGAHVACEWVSNILTKLLQRGRLAAYLEQSTRYIPYDKPLPGDGGYRFYRDAELGPRLYGRNPDLCCYLRKVEPLEKSLAPYDAWFTGVRREETASRRDTRVVEWDEKRQMIKVNPIVAWTGKQVDDYIAENGVLVNPLVYDGYPSIGCRTCTICSCRRANNSHPPRRTARSYAGPVTPCCVTSAVPCRPPTLTLLFPPSTRRV